MPPPAAKAKNSTAAHAISVIDIKGWRLPPFSRSVISLLILPAIEEMSLSLLSRSSIYALPDIWLFPGAPDVILITL